MRPAKFGLLALALVFGMIAQGNAKEAGDDHHSSGVIGTYWISIDAGFPTPLPGLLAFTPGGRIIAIEGQGPETAGLGSWEARAGRTIAGTFIWFLALNAGTGPDGGRYTLIGKVDFTGRFEDRINTVELPFTVSIFSIDQDPLVDAPLFSVPGVMTARLLRVGAP